MTSKRQESIEIRNKETDVIKLLSKYAKNQGSKNPEMLYMVYTKLVYKMLNIESGMRGNFDYYQLSLIATNEIIIAQTVLELMEKNIHYKSIYKMVKEKLEILATLVAPNKLYSSNGKIYNLGFAS